MSHKVEYFGLATGWDDVRSGNSDQYQTNTNPPAILNIDCRAHVVMLKSRKDRQTLIWLVRLIDSLPQADEGTWVLEVSRFVFKFSLVWFDIRLHILRIFFFFFAFLRMSPSTTSSPCPVRQLGCCWQNQTVWSYGLQLSPSNRGAAGHGADDDIPRAIYLTSVTYGKQCELRNIRIELLINI